MGKRQRKLKRKINKTGIVFATAFLVIGVFIYLLALPSFKFSSDTVKIEAGSTFEAKTYITKVRNININKIVVSNNVDSKKPGEYKATYIYKNIKKTLTGALCSILSVITRKTNQILNTKNITN